MRALAIVIWVFVLLFMIGNSLTCELLVERLVCVNIIVSIAVLLKLIDKEDEK